MNKYQPRPINSTLDKQKQINTVDQNVRDVYKILNNLPQLQGASGVVKRSELLDATMMALDSSLNIASTGFLYQTGAAAFTKRSDSQVLSDIGGIGGSGTAGYVPIFTAGTTLGNSVIFQNGTNLGIGYTAPLSALCVNGGINIGDQAAIAADESLRISYNSTYHAGFGSDIYNNMHVLLDYASGGRFIIRDYTDTHDYAAFGPTLNTIYTPTNFSDAVLFASTITVSGLSTAGIVTNTSAGLLGTTSFGTTAGTVCQGNDSRLSALSLTTGYIPKAASATTLGNSPLYTDGTNVSIGTTSPNNQLAVINSTSTFPNALVAFELTNASATNGLLYLDHEGTGYILDLVRGGASSPASGDWIHWNDASYGPSSGGIKAGGVWAWDTQLYGDQGLSLSGNGYSAASPSMVINTWGNVGIGYTAPLSALCVNGGVNIGSDAALASGLGITLSSTADNKTFSFLEGTTPKASIGYYGTTYSNSLLRGLRISSINQITLLTSGVGAKIDLQSPVSFESGIVLAASGKQTDASNGGAIDFYCNVTHTLVWLTTAPTSDLVVTIRDTPIDGAIIFIHSFNQNDCLAINIGGNVINGCGGSNQRSCMIKYVNSVWCKVSDYLGSL